MMEDMPFTQSPVWKQRLQRSLHKNRAQPEARYVQLGTRSKLGVDVRTLVWRGFYPQLVMDDGRSEEYGQDVQDHSFYFVSDKRTAKMEHIAADSNVGICWYFAKTREQYRFNGRLQFIDCNDTLNAAWQRLSLSAQMDYFGPAPGVPLGEFRPEQPLERLGGADRLSHHPSFCVLVFTSEYSDYLSLSRPAHQRFIEQRSGQGWLERAVGA